MAHFERGKSLNIHQHQNIFFYFAYGSNLHPVRIQERVPSADLVGTVEVTHHRLAFQKKGQDGSAKCHLAYTGDEWDLVHGAVYQIDAQHKPQLDRCEGKGNGYFENSIMVECQGKAYSCFTYFAQSSHMAEDLKPFHWYKALVILGAKHLQFPSAYVQSIESIESIEDPDEYRREQHILLIEQILRCSRSGRGMFNERVR